MNAIFSQNNFLCCIGSKTWLKKIYKACAAPLSNLSHHFYVGTDFTVPLFRFRIIAMLKVFSGNRGQNDNHRLGVTSIYLIEITFKITAKTGNTTLSGKGLITSKP